MIHITDFNGDIIDFISKSDGAVTEAEHMINVEDKLETFDFTVLTSRTEHMQKRNRVIIEDKDGQYREFIIYNISSDLNGYTRVQTNASALEDIKTAKPVAPHKLDKHTVKQALEYALADTGWEVSDEAEWGGTRTTSWTGWHDRISILKQLETTYGMRLSFHVEVGSNRIENRYVSLNKVEPMFNGEEIVYGDNMIDLKRTVDFSDIATALICLGPEDNETGKREIVEVKDDDAQAQFGLPYRYIWDIYEPQSSDENMTRQRLTTLGRTALNKRKQESISYEIDGIGLSASAGDMIRVKNEDFTPELYVDAEVVEVTTDLISGESQYKFGVIKEYTRDDVYARFNAMLSGLRERLNKVVENTDSIISERLEEELKYVERYIEKSPTPPLNPKENQLWLDTSHDGVAVLKRYENGEWIKSSVDNVKEIGGMTREETMYEALKERLVRKEVNYSQVSKRHGALVSEKHYHYVDEDIKNDLSSRYNALQQSYDDFKQTFNNINAEQPTIGLITTTISRAVEFEARLKEYNDSYYIARKSFDEVFGILQSQYSDEKYSDAMQELAEQIGGEWNGNELIVDGKVHEKFYDVRNELERQDNLLKNTIDETEYISDELSKSQSSLEQYSHELNTKVGYTEMNGTQQTLEKLLTEFSQTADGFNFRIDSNGMIQDLTFDRNAFKLNSNLIEFNDGDVIIKDGVTTIKDAYIDKLFSKMAFIEQLKAVDIDFNRASAYGSNGSSYLKIVSDKIELAGTYDRTWRGIRSTRQIKTELFDGGINFINSTDNRSLWYSDFGVSTFKDGDGEGTSSGTLAFFDTTHSSGGARGVTLVSNTGVVALETKTSAQNILLKSSGNVQVTTVGVLKVSQGAGDGYTESHLLMPRETSNLYAGFENEFRFTNRDFYNDGNTIYNRFRASIGFVHGLQNNASGANPGTHLYLGSLAGEVQVVRDVSATNKVYGNARMSGLYVDELIPHSYSAIIMRTGLDVRGNILLPSNEQIRTSGGYLTLRAGNGYLFLQTDYEARVVSPGTTNSYMPIRASNFFEGSSEKFKDVIGIWNYDALSVIKDEVQLYSYTLKNNEGKSFNKINHSVIIERETPAEWIIGDGVDIREVSMWGIRAIQQLAHENDTLKDRINDLENKLNKIMEMIT